ncbi:MAG: type II toxin-antitoxin system prevent-host-death family antitoxin [Lentisphaerae bacterium]|nr:type II toxin-antitoxin system prevent-host-death family antitoxin [Lentisphaerota bacterium]
MKATACDLRYHLKSVMESVQRGEDVFITNRGRIKAKIVPVDSPAKESEEENLFVGMWKHRKDMKDVRTYLRQIRRGRFS